MLVALVTAITCLVSVTCGMEGIVTTVAGGGFPHVGHVDTCTEGPSSVDGALKQSRFNYPWGIAFDSDRKSLFVADCGCPDVTGSNDRIRKIDIKSDVVTTIAGSDQGYKDGTGTDANFFHSAGMSFNSEDNTLFIADSGNNAIRSLDLSTNQVSTLAGDGHCGYVDAVPAKAKFCNPQGVKVAQTKNALYVADTDNHAIRLIPLLGNKKTLTISGGPDKEGFVDGNLATAKWKHPTSLVYDEIDDVIYVSDHYNHAIRLIDFNKGTVTTLLGNGRAGSIAERGVAHKSPHGAVLHYPEGLALDRDNKVLYFVEFGNNCVSMFSLRDRSLALLAGGAQYGTRDAVGTDAQFYHPTNVDFDDVNKVLYVTDQYNHRVRAVTTLGNRQFASSGKMKLQHLGKVDAYRDLIVHNRSSVYGFVYVTMVALFCFLLYCTRHRWIAFLKVKYAIYNKNEQLRF